MNKLLSANFTRLKRDKIFWITTAAMLILSAVVMINSGKYADVDSNNVVKTINEVYFNLVPIIGTFCAVFILLFLGAEYSDGTIRNKIVIGHKRADIYIADYITAFAGSAVIYIAMLIGGLTGIFYFGTWTDEISGLIAYIAIGLFLIASITSILTLISMLCTNKAISAVLTILISIFLMIAASSIYQVLCEPETTREMVSITLDGVVLGDEIANPAYVSGWKRQLFEWLLDFLPTGQGIKMANLEVTNPVVNIVYSIIFTVIVNISGVFAFRRKDLK